MDSLILALTALADERVRLGGQGACHEREVVAPQGALRAAVYAADREGAGRAHHLLADLAVRFGRPNLELAPAARACGISRKALWEKRKRYGIP